RWVLVQDRMSLLLLAALWVHLLSCVLLVGAFFTLLLAGPPRRPFARRWEETVVARSRMLVLAAIGSGIVWLLVRTAVFEGRSQAALEPRAVWHAVIDTRPGLVWLARHGLLIVLAAFLPFRARGDDRPDHVRRRECDRAGREHGGSGRNDARPPAPGQARRPRPDPRAGRREPHARSSCAVRTETLPASRRVRRAGSSSRPRLARPRRGDDTDDARSPRSARVAAAVPLFSRRPARRTGDEVARSARGPTGRTRRGRPARVAGRAAPARAGAGWRARARRRRRWPGSSSARGRRVSDDVSAVVGAL